jgi:hypothetical protein
MCIDVQLTYKQANVSDYDLNCEAVRTSESPVEISTHAITAE